MGGRNGMRRHTLSLVPQRLRREPLAECLSRSLRDEETLDPENAAVAPATVGGYICQERKWRRRDSSAMLPTTKKYHFLSPALLPLPPRLISHAVCACELPTVSSSMTLKRVGLASLFVKSPSVSSLSVQTSHACDFRPVSHCTTRGHPCAAQLSPPIVLESLSRVDQPGCCVMRGRRKPSPCPPRVRHCPTRCGRSAKSQNQ